VVDQAMNEAGVTRQYKELIGRYQAIPFVRHETFDIEQNPHGPGGAGHGSAEGGIREMSKRGEGR